MTPAWLLAGAVATALWAQPHADGQKRYDAGDFEGAAAAFRQAVAAEPREPAWHYDLGNALFKAGRLGPAIASYQRAFDLAPRDRDVRDNLSFSLKRAGEDLVPPGVPAALFALFYWASATELAGLHWLFCWVALLLAACWIAAPARRPALGTPLIAALCCWALAGLWWGARRALEPEARGVIARPVAELRSGPGDGFSVSFTVPEGRRVEILSDAGAWFEVGLPREGAKGWLKAADVEKL